MTESANPKPKFWNGKRVLLTGHTGFKGSWLTIWLNRLGARVTGISLPAATTPSLFDVAEVEPLCEHHLCDIRNADVLSKIVKAARPEIVFHLAAQPVLRVSYRQPVETFSTNVMGTAHVLEAVRGLENVRAAVMVTTDKVYRNNEWPWPYREDDVLGGHDPYSASKAASEIVIASYRDSFLSNQGTAIASARAGNVIGGGDWSEDRLVPDVVRAWQAGKPANIRRPQATRPWQYVLESLTGYLILAQKLWERSCLEDAYNFGPRTDGTATVREVVELARNAYGAGAVYYGDGTDGPHEARWLTLEIARARELLGYYPRLSLAAAVNRTMEWYREQHQGAAARTLCEEEIAAYVAQE